jgi:hypothetical protein
MSRTVLQDDVGSPKVSVHDSAFVNETKFF